MFTTLSEMLSSDGFDAFCADKLGNNLFLSDPERATRINDHAESGADGSTHRERIEDMRDYLGTFNFYRLDLDGELENESYWQEVESAINAEIDACESRHVEAGTIDQIAG